MQVGGGIIMLVEVEIIGGNYCSNKGGCIFLKEVIDSFGYEESHNECAYLKIKLNDEAKGSWERITKHPNCPSLKG